MSEHLLGVFDGSSELFQRTKAFRYRALLSSIVVVVVNESLAQTLLHFESFWEVLNVLDKVALALRVCWIVNEDNSLNILLARSPAFLVFEIATNVPELDMDFAELRNSSWWVSLEVNDSCTDGWSVNSGEAVLKVAQDIG